MSLSLPKHVKLLPAYLALVFASANHTMATAATRFFTGIDHFKPAYHQPGARNAAFLKPKKQSDKELVLQKCFDLPALQPFFPKDSAGVEKQLYVLQHGVAFPADFTVSKGGMPVAYIEKAQIAANTIDAYFLFFEFTITDKSAKVDFVFNYDQTSPLKKMQVVSLELVKKGSTWTIVQSKVEERAS